MRIDLNSTYNKEGTTVHHSTGGRRVKAPKSFRRRFSSKTTVMVSIQFSLTIFTAALLLMSAQALPTNFEKRDPGCNWDETWACILKDECSCVDSNVSYV